MGPESKIPQLTGDEKVIPESRRATAPFDMTMTSFISQIRNINLINEPSNALEHSAAVLPIPRHPSYSASGTLVELPDSRDGYQPHRAYAFSVAASQGTVLDELRELLGCEDEASMLAREWGTRCNLNKELRATEVVLFLDSNNKPRFRFNAKSVAETTQGSDLSATSHEFADPLATTLLSARTFEKFRSKRGVSEGERELYTRLHTGIVRCSLGGLGIRAGGRLGAFGVGGLSSQNGWYVGQPIRSSTE